MAGSSSRPIRSTPTDVLTDRGAVLPAADVEDPARPGIAGGLALLIVIALAAAVLASFVSFLSPLVVGVALGALVANIITVPERFAPGAAFAARTLLRLGVVLLGFRLSIGDLAGLGVPGLAVVAIVVGATFCGTQWLGRRLGVPDDLGLLVATGYSICGASAIAAMDGVVGADEEETAYAITLVTLCGTLAICVLPALAGPLGLTGDAFGSWVGASVHDVGQAIATASHGSASAVATATVVKLTRVVLLAPLVAVVAVRRRRISTGAATGTRPPIIPLFVAGFIAAVAIRSTGVVGEPTLGAIAGLEKAVLTVALVGLGMGVRVDRMRRLGGRPLLLGLLSWVLVGTAAYVGTIAVL
jgi:uncharacterized integral membrane protein (TIGR00698 family)